MKKEKKKKQKYLLIPVRLRVSILEVTEKLMYEFCYDYLKPK